MTADTGRRLAIVAVFVTIGLLAAGAVAGVSGLSQMGQPSGDEVLDGAEQRYDAAETITGTATVTVANDSASTTATVEYAAAEPNKTWAAVTSEDRSYEMGTNGTVVWAVGENKSYGRELPEDPAVMNDTTDPVPEENVTATLRGTAEVDGESTYVLDLEPTNESLDAPNTTLWVDTEDYRVHKLTTDDGTNRTEVVVEETKFNVSIDDSQFAPPADRVAVTTTETYDTYDAAQSATDLDLPAYEAGAFEEARYISRPESTAVAQQYDAGGENVTVLTATGASSYLDDADNGTAVQVNGQNATAIERDDSAVVYWTEDDVTTGVVIEGTTEEAVAVAEGL
ncbi:outer membrane lipoprotein carrier protein LolA [Haloarcula sp. S1AR25-5A]|uniref:Outer membrane lipoprotein carrier protein LolA n=1 Tax=Haloarcula terrestris TaxID=2950533 RepID=A0AAE4EW73_9EURY|nr:outer membrane lipoprotein carrier protein LolA [Haloarcula terrestris]MDS0221335.1 outer membrane lipoprotein carrier protein LolA [Haloarcula terrestris]